MKLITDEEGNKLGMTGRAGLLFESRTGQYFIDREGLAGPQAGVVIYTNVIQRIVEGNTVDDLNREQKTKIIKQVVKLLQVKGIYFELIGDDQIEI